MRKLMNYSALTRLVAGALCTYALIGAASAETTLRLAVGDPIGSAVGKAGQDFAERVEKATGGEVKVKVFPDGVLFGGNQNAAVNMLQDGSLDAVILSTSDYASFDPCMNAISLPYLFKDYEQFAAFLKGEPGQKLLNSLDRLNTEGLALMIRTFRHVTNSKRPIEKPEDLQGLKLRIPNNKLWVEFFGPLGANPTPMDFKEVYTALQLDTIDGQENPVEVPLANKFYEVQDYLSMTGHLSDRYILAVNQDAWKDLKPDVQKAIQTATQETADFKFKNDLSTEVLDGNGIGYAVFPDIESEPDARSIVEAVDAYRKGRGDAIVAVGGGSALDAGKAISVMLTNPGHIRDYAGLGLVQQPSVPFIAIPTTAGTGNDSTIWAVISEKDRGGNYGVGRPLLVPKIALCDPELSLTLPPRITAVTGVDAMSHALESFVNKATQPISESLSEHALSLVAKSLRTAVFAGDTITARADMLLASSMAAIAFNSTRLGLARALAMPLGAQAKIPLADVIAILMPPVIRFNMLGNLEESARLADIFGRPVGGMPVRDAAEVGVHAVFQLIEDVGAPRRLSDYGVQESDLQKFAEAGMQTGNIPVNPRVTTAADLVNIMRECL